MKATLILACLVMMSLSSQAGKDKPKHRSIHVVSRSLDCFYFKVSKEVIGAEIEVYSDKGEKLITQTIKGKRTLIDFYYEQPGSYTIKINKGDFTESFEYSKKDPSPFVPIEVEHVKIVQGNRG
jgi:hypothetical protein